jgi:hypothetical protein
MQVGVQMREDLVDDRLVRRVPRLLQQLRDVNHEDR